MTAARLFDMGMNRRQAVAIRDDIDRLRPRRNLDRG